MNPAKFAFSGRRRVCQYAVPYGQGGEVSCLLPPQITWRRLAGARLKQVGRCCCCGTDMYILVFASLTPHSCPIPQPTAAPACVLWSACLWMHSLSGNAAGRGPGGGFVSRGAQGFACSHWIKRVCPHTSIASRCRSQAAGPKPHPPKPPPPCPLGTARGMQRKLAAGREAAAPAAAAAPVMHGQQHL